MGLGRNNHAIWAVVVNANAGVADKVEANRLPPGAPVVSTSTTVELASCAGGVALLEGDTVAEPLLVGDTVRVPDVVPVTEGVTLLDGVPDRETVGVTELVGLGVNDGVGGGVSLLLGVNVGESDDKLPGDGVPVPVPDEEGVNEGDTEGVGLGLGSTTPWMYTPSP